jgi:hypothetical protein
MSDGYYCCLVMWCLIAGGIAFVTVPAAMVVAAYRETTRYDRGVCSSAIANVRRQPAGIGAWTVSVLTRETSTNTTVKLIYPPVPGVDTLVAVRSTDISVWLAGVSAGAPTATFDCFVQRSAANETTPIAISERYAFIGGWYAALFFGALFLSMIALTVALILVKVGCCAAVTGCIGACCLACINIPLGVLLACCTAAQQACARRQPRAEHAGAPVVWSVQKHNDGSVPHPEHWTTSDC